MDLYEDVLLLAEVLQTISGAPNNFRLFLFFSSFADVLLPAKVMQTISGAPAMVFVVKLN